MTERIITHFVGDECEPNGHRPDTLIERLRAELERECGHQVLDCAHRDYRSHAVMRDAAAALERAERVVEAERAKRDHDPRCTLCLLDRHCEVYHLLSDDAERAWDAYDTTRADTVRE